MDRYEERFRGRVPSMVRKLRNKIECVAVALMEKTTLTGAEVEELLL